MAIYFTADTHFGHDAIRTLADRPFATVEAMDNELVHRWNTIVKPGDTVWHVGDFAHRSSKSIADYRSRLNGTIHLVLGNHDTTISGKNASLFASVQTMAEVNTVGKTIILCHYPLREWDKAWRGAWHLHGHVHGRFDEDIYGHSLDVGVDSHNYQPINLDRISVLLAGRKTPFVRDELRSAQSRLQNESRRLRFANTPIVEEEP